VKPKVTMRRALSDDGLLGRALPGDSWAAWRILLIAIMGEELTDDERTIFRSLTSRDHEPGFPVEEFWAVIGRRGGKTRAMATLSVYLAALCRWRLVPGERGKLSYVAATQRQAALALGYARALLHGGPMLKGIVSGESQMALELRNGIDLEVRAASFRSIRGITSIAAVVDEIAFLQTSEYSSNPDSEILGALRPSLATTRGPLICISSPHARRGELWSTFKRHYGPEGDPAILVAHGPSRALNPSLPQSVIDRAMERDPAAAGAEFMAEFRSDLEVFVAREVVEGCMSSGVIERPRDPLREYHGFVDPSGGAHDAMTLAIAHQEGDVAVLDCLREVRPPFSPEVVVGQFAETLREYALFEVTGDAYAAEWCRESFRRAGVTYRRSSLTRSQLFLHLLPALNSGQVDLLDSDRLVGQLVGLERQIGRSGRESVDHAPGQHDDLANAAAGALWLASREATPTVLVGTWGMTEPRPEPTSGMFSAQDYLRAQGRLR
jgi:hypothetical protein